MAAEGRSGNHVLILSFLFVARLRHLLGQNLARVSLLLVGVVVYGTISEYALEHGAPGTGVGSPFDSLWFVMQTLTTVGYGDTPVVTFWGRMNAIFLMFSGIGILGLFTASFASVLIDRSVGKRGGWLTVRLKGHIIVCNWNAIAEELVREVLGENPRLVVLAQAERSPAPGAEFVRGTCLHTADLVKANVKDADSVIILAETIADGELASAIDAKTILGIMNARKLSKDVHVVVELLRSDSLENARLAGADEVVVRGDVSAKLLARGALDPGTIDVVETILTERSGQEIFEDHVPDWSVGKAYGELIDYYLERGATPIALRDSGGLRINPRKADVLNRGSVIYIAKERIEA